MNKFATILLVVFSMNVFSNNISIINSGINGININVDIYVADQSEKKYGYNSENYFIKKASDGLPTRVAEEMRSISAPDELPDLTTLKIVVIITNMNNPETLNAGYYTFTNVSISNDGHFIIPSFRVYINDENRDSPQVVPE